MNAIVSVTADWGIGLEGRLVVPNREDMRRFTRLTCGGRTPKQAAQGEVLGSVIMGRRTLESFPAGPLKARRNIVLTRDATFAVDGVEVAHSVDDALALVADEDPDTVWLIGGESVYRQLLPYCTHAYVTKNDISCPCDAFFPNLDADEAWMLLERSEEGVTAEGVSFSYCTYVRTDS